jgi:SAD/SRA domain
MTDQSNINDAQALFEQNKQELLDWLGPEYHPKSGLTKDKSTEAEPEDSIPASSIVARGDHSQFVNPDWYTRRTLQRQPSTTEERKSLPSLTGIIETFKRIQSNAQGDKIRELHHLIQTAVFMETSAELIKVRKMFDKRDGLPAIAVHPLIPWYIQADAKSLYFQWHQKCFKFDPLVGTELRLNKKQKLRRSTVKDAKKLDVYRNAQKFGHNFIDNGQWWPYMMCAWLSGAHGSQEYGVWGEKNKGAYSIIFSMTYDGDEDHGDTIFYTGTKSKPGSSTPTESTQWLLDSAVKRENDDRRPVRVLRGCVVKRRKNNIFAPKVGYRYDGLYYVVEWTLIDAKTHHYRFKLVRCPGQDPIRYIGPEIRPNTQETQWWADDKQQQGQH